MTDHLNRVKRQGLRGFTSHPSRSHGNPISHLANPLRPFPMPPSIPEPFYPYQLYKSPQHPVSLVPQHPISQIREGSAPSSPIPQSRPWKGSQRWPLSWLAGGISSKPTKKKSKRVAGLRTARELRDENPHTLLIHGYGVAEKDRQVPFQPRRTLDQYFYSHLDNTAHRDKDQVVYRYTRNEDAKIFMVDQMWLWIINGGLQSPQIAVSHTIY